MTIRPPKPEPPKIEYGPLPLTGWNVLWLILCSLFVIVWNYLPWLINRK